jgi:hypothetical protein
MRAPAATCERGDSLQSAYAMLMRDGAERTMLFRHY